MTATTYGAAAPRDRQGFFFGLTGPQVFLVAAAGVPVWLAMAVGEWLALGLLIPAWAVAGLLICVPVRGWSAAQWIGVLARHLAGAAFGWTTWRSRAAAGELEDLGEADLPGCLAAIQIHDGPPLAGSATRPAIVQNHAARTWAVTARIEHSGIGLADEDERWRMGAGLAELCESASAAGQIHLIAVQVRTVPDDGTERADWVRRHIRAGEPEIATANNAQLDAAMSGVGVRHEAFVTVVAHEDAIGKDARRAGRGMTGRARILYTLIAEVEARLTGAIGCTRVEWLDTADLAVAVRTGFEPGDAAALHDAAIHAARNPKIATAVPLAAAGPATASTAMRCYRHGDWASVAATILLPAKGAVMGALARTLVPSQPGERRALTVFYRPVPQRTANARTGRKEMSAAMGAEMRRRVGKIERAQDRRDQAQVRETDEKLTGGRSLVQVSSAISITIPGQWDAHDYGRRLDASIRLCGFAPLPLDGAHDAAFAAATLPLASGLRRSGR